MTKHIHYFICGNKSPTKGEQQNLIIRACYSNKVSHCHLRFSAESKVGRGEEKFIAEKGSLQVCLAWRGGCWQGEAGQLEVGHLM